MDGLAQGAGALTVDDRDGAELGHDGGVDVVVDHVKNSWLAMIMLSCAKNMVYLH